MTIEKAVKEIGAEIGRHVAKHHQHFPLFGPTEVAAYLGEAMRRSAQPGEWDSDRLPMATRIRLEKLLISTYQSSRAAAVRP